jgi:formylglycine-generating enzyme required for sulfatase activity
MNFCSWAAQEKKFAPNSVRLPTIAEFRRAAQGMTIRGHGVPTAPDYWDVAKFWSRTEPSPVMTTPWDKIYNGKGQMYDLISNVAEWGADVQAEKRAVLGGGFTDKAHDFNAMQPRWISADSTQDWLGFRYVHLLEN